jgi:alpha-glucan,water dikinase
LDPAFITNFGEEVVRGQPVFVLSGLLQDLEKSLRAAAGAGPWQVSGPGAWCGGTGGREARFGSGGKSGTE